MRNALVTYITEYLVHEVEHAIDSFLISHEEFNGNIVLLYSKYEPVSEKTQQKFREKYNPIFKQVVNPDLEILHSRLKGEVNQNPSICQYLIVESLGLTQYDRVYAISPKSSMFYTSDSFVKMGDVVFFKRDPTYREDKKLIVRQGPTLVNPSFFIINKPAMGVNYPSFLYKNLIFNRDLSTAMTYFLVNYLSTRCQVKILENTAFPIVENFPNQAIPIFLSNRSKMIGLDFTFVNNVNQKNYVKILDLYKKNKESVESEIKERLFKYSPNNSYDNPDVDISTEIPEGLKFNLQGQYQSLCIVVSFRNRDKHLEVFIPYITAYLENVNNIHNYEIVIVEQADSKPFNRAKLFNVGFKESQGFDYYCFHDVDLIPLTADYSYSDKPTHLATNCEQFNYKLPYPEYWGGVLLAPTEVIEKVNGWSNDYWGWGAEDDDFYYRLVKGKCDPVRRLGSRYRSLAHASNADPAIRDRNWRQFLDAKNSDFDKHISSGLSNLEYKVIDTSGYGKIKFIKVLL